MFGRTCPFLATVAFLLTPQFSNASPEGVFESANLTDLAEITTRLVENCFLKNDRTVTVAGNVYDDLVKELHLSEAITMTTTGKLRSNAQKVYAESLHWQPLYTSNRSFRHQRTVQGFVVGARSQRILRLTLEWLKNSVWWNSYGLFVIIEESPVIDGCRYAHPFLWTAWNLGLLSSLFLCLNADGQLTMYSYNPYRNYAPKPWRRVGEYKGRNGHPWTLFKQVNGNGPAACEIIFFDKTEKLDGYPIRTNMEPAPPYLDIRSNVTGMTKFVGPDGMVTRSLWRTLNATMVEMAYTGTGSFGFANETGSYTGMLGDVSHARVDFSLNGRYMVQIWKVSTTYPHAITGYCFLIKSKGSLPQWWKLVTFADTPSSVSVLAILSMSVVLLARFEKQGYCLALLDVLRMLLSAALLRPPRTNYVRIFLITIIILILVVNAIFMGHLKSLLTVPMDSKNIDTLQELEDSGYSIHGYPPFKSIFKKPVLRQRYRGETNTSRCVENLTKGKPVACIGDCLKLNAEKLMNENLHLGKEIIIDYYVLYTATQDWPLLERFNVLIQRMVEAGLEKHWREMSLQEVDRSHWAKIRATSLPNFEPLRLSQIIFMFYVLIFGLTCSTIAFIVELTKVQKPATSVIIVKMRGR